MIGSESGRTLSTIFFFVFVAISLGITYWAARRAQGGAAFFAAGRSLSAWQNGLAIAGDYMSAAAFLGITGLVSLFGFDGLMYSMGFVVAWILVVLVVAEPLRNAGKYTISDVMAYRLRARPVRLASAVSSVTIVLFYLLAQMVGIGAVTTLLLPIDPNLAIALVGVLMTIYVVFGGMVATTYVQMVKAILLMSAAVLLTLLLLLEFDFSISGLLSGAAEASGKGDAFLEPGLNFTNKLDLISLGLGLALGTAGLPHIMMRFYTVPDARTARRSVNWVIGINGTFLLMTTLLGFGAAALVGAKAITAANPAGNSAGPLLALELGGGPDSLAGSLLLAFVAAVAFATILAVVAGLTIAAAANIAHDLYTHVIRRGDEDEDKEVRVAKVATLAVGAVAILLAFAAKSLNVAFLVGLAFAVAASANLPVVLYSLFWKRFNTPGAVASIVVGLVTAVGIVLVSPAVIGEEGIMLKGVEPLISLTNPGVVSIPAGFLAGWLATMTTSRERLSGSRFEALRLRALSGFGAERSSEP